MDAVPHFCCLNHDCPDHGKRGVGNLAVIGRDCPENDRRMCRCVDCVDP